MWGALIGLLFLVPIAGIAIGAGLGALAGKASDYGIDDKFMKDLTKEMKPESSALFVLGDSESPDKLTDAMSQYGGKIITSSLPMDAQKKIQKELDEKLCITCPCRSLTKFNLVLYIIKQRNELYIHFSLFVI